LPFTFCAIEIIGQMFTALYFSYFLIIVPFVTLLENSLIDLATNPKVENNFVINISYQN